MSTRKAGLGKGLDSLLPGDFDTGLLLDKEDRIQKIAISKITPNPNQPRKKFEEGAINELADSIKTYGVLMPIIVAPSQEGRYEIIAGERRWRASIVAGIDSLPVIIRDRKDLERLEISLIENVQRVDLSPIEQAVSIERLHQEFNTSYKEISKRLGKADTTLINIVRLLGLPGKSRQALEDKQISEGHARAILAIKDWPDQQEELLRQIIKNTWTVRQAEQFALNVKGGKSKTTPTKHAVTKTNNQTERLSKMLGAPVSFSRLAKGGKLEIGFKDDDELERITKTIADAISSNKM